MTSHRKRESTLPWKSYDLKRAENGWRREKVIVTRNLFVLSTILCYHFLCWLYSTTNSDFVIHYYYGWVDSAERRKKCHDKKFDWYPSWWQTRIKPVEPVFCQFFDICRCCRDWLWVNECLFAGIFLTHEKFLCCFYKFQQQKVYCWKKKECIKRKKKGSLTTLLCTVEWKTICTSLCTSHPFRLTHMGVLSHKVDVTCFWKPLGFWRRPGCKCSLVHPELLKGLVIQVGHSKLYVVFL